MDTETAPKLASPAEQLDRIATALERIADALSPANLSPDEDRGPLERIADALDEDRSHLSLGAALDRIDGHLEMLASVVREDPRGDSLRVLGDVNTYPQD